MWEQMPHLHCRNHVLRAPRKALICYRRDSQASRKVDGSRKLDGNHKVDGKCTLGATTGFNGPVPFPFLCHYLARQHGCRARNISEYTSPA